MTKPKLDYHLADYLAECAALDIQEFATSYFHLYTTVVLYKDYGEAFAKIMRTKINQDKS